MRPKILLLLIVFATSSALRAQEAEDPAVTRLREALKATMLQLRDAQAQVAALQASEAQSQIKLKGLEAQLSRLTKEAADDKTAADALIAALREQLLTREKEADALHTSLRQWKEGYEKAAGLAHAKEKARAALETKAVELQRRVDDQQRRNAEMYRTAMDLLERYKKFGLGEAISSREPFTGITRVKLQNLVQDDSDKLNDSKIQ